MELKEKMKVIESISDGGSTFEVLEFENLDGASDPIMAMGLYFAKQAGLRSRIVRVRWSFRSYYGYGALLCKTGWAKI